MANAIPEYLFVIVDQDGGVHEFEKATSRAWERYENDVGRCRFFIPYNDVKLTSTSIDDTRHSEIRIYRNNVLVWQGFVMIIQDTIDGTWVYGEDFKVGLKWSGVRYDQLHDTVNVSSLITDEYDNIETRSNNFLTGKITQGTIENPYQTGTTTDLTITRTLFNENFFDILLQMSYFARAEMTSSWSQQTVFDISLSESAPTFSFLRDVGTDKEAVVFELDSEIIDFNFPRDLRFIENEHKGFAILSGPSVINSTEADATSAGNWYRREAYPFYNNINTQTDLDNRVDDRNDERSDPNRVMNLKFAAGLVPFDGYSLGDSIRLRISRGRVNVNELRRVIGMEVAVSETGVEITTPILQKART